MLAVMCAGYFLVLLDVTIVNVALPQIGPSLGASVSGLQWVVDGYAIALAGTMLAAGALGDARGHRRIVLAGLALFGFASLGCSAGMLVAARVLQGLGAALLLPGTLATIAEAYPRGDEQARAIGIWAGVGSIALPAGPLLGGALVESLGWRAVFAVNVPIVVVAFVAALRVAPPERGRAQRRHVDWPGTALGASFLALLTFAFIDAGRSGASPVVLVAAALAAAALAAFLTVERRSPRPTLPPALFRSRAFASANSVAATMNLCTLGLLFVLTLYLQRVLSDSPLDAGLRLLPLFLPLAVIAPLAGRLTARGGAARPVASGLVLAAAGLALLALADGHTSYGTLLPALLLWGIGLGVVTPAVVAAAIAAVPEDRRGMASAVNNTARQAGGALGIAAFGALAGSPANRAGFLSGMHLGALLAAGLYVAAAAAALAWVRR